MQVRTIAAAIFTSVFAASVLAQGNDRSAVDLPKACEAAAQSGGKMMEKMPSMGEQPTMQDMAETQEGLSQAMMTMQPAMTRA